MDISREEARESLNQVQATIKQTKKMVAYGGGDVAFIMWGLIWIAGSMSNQFVPLICKWIWLGLLVTGFIMTGLLVKFRNPVKSRTDWRIGLFWFFLFGYVYLWLALLFPFIKVEEVQQVIRFWKHFTAIMCTVAMFAYVVIGLWLEDFMIWLGLALTALILAGLFLLQPYFYFWTAAVGGGTLIGTGIFIRNRWR